MKKNDKKSSHHHVGRLLAKASKNSAQFSDCGGFQGHVDSMPNAKAQAAIDDMNKWAERNGYKPAVPLNKVQREAQRRNHANIHEFYNRVENPVYFRLPLYSADYFFRAVARGDIEDISNHVKLAGFNADCFHANNDYKTLTPLEQALSSEKLSSFMLLLELGAIDIGNGLKKINELTSSGSVDYHQGFDRVIQINADQLGVKRVNGQYIELRSLIEDDGARAACQNPSPSMGRC